MIKSAIAMASKAKKGEKDNTTLRQAAEWGWLAAASTADVVAKRLGLKATEGFGGRKDALAALDEESRLKGRFLENTLKLAHEELHGRTFHGNERTREDVLSTLAGVEVMVEEALRLLTWRRR